MDDYIGNKQRVLGYTDELGNMLKHVKNHMPKTRLQEQYPGTEDEGASFGTTESPFPIKAPFSIMFVDKDVTTEDEEGNPVNETKTFICVCNNAVSLEDHDGETDAYPSYFRVPRLIKDDGTDTYELPITYSEKPIDEIFPTTTTNSSVTYSVCVFVHFVKKKVYLKLRATTIPSPEEYMLGIASLKDWGYGGFLASSFVCYEIGKIRIRRTLNDDNTHTYQGTVLENMSRNSLFDVNRQTSNISNWDSVAFSITSYFLLGRYQVVLDITESDDTLKFNSSGFVYNNKICIRPTGTNETIPIYVNGNVLFNVSPVDLTIPEAKYPAVIIKFVPPNNDDTDISCGSLCFALDTSTYAQTTPNSIRVMTYYNNTTHSIFTVGYLNTEITDVLYKETWNFSNEQ